MQVAWTCVKYAIDRKTDVTLSYYREWQNDFREPRTCSPAAGFRSSCAGNLDEISLFADHHLFKWFDVYGGIAVSDVGDGLAIAIPQGPGVPYYRDTNIAPTLGGRFTF